MLYIKGDITCVVHGIVAHQVNCVGVYKDALPMRMKRAWPVVHDDYINAFMKGQLVLGQVVFSHPSKLITIASMCAQEGYNYVSASKVKHVDYKALRDCLSKVNEWRKILECRVYIPYMMGCDTSGADWDLTYKIIKTEIPNAIIVEDEVDG